AVIATWRREARGLEVGAALALERRRAIGPRVLVLGKRHGLDRSRAHDAVQLDLVAAAEQQRSLAVHLPIALDEPREHALAGGGVQRAGVDLDVDGRDLLAEAHAERA